jgi:myo-inositol-hexaphosphate 3-phosphohydrolase
MPPSLVLAALLTATAMGAALAQEVYPVPVAVETPMVGEDFRDASADDPAFWVHPADPARTLVITAIKNAGMQVHDLAGAVVQDLPAAPEADGEAGRINNVDVIYGVPMADGTTIDVAVGSDRGQDIIRVWRIDGDAAAPLTEITDMAAGRAFPMRPDPAGGADQENPLGDQMTAYGITGWTADGAAWVAVTQRTNPRVGIFRLVPTADGLIGHEMVHDVRVPWAFRGQDLMVENDDDPRLDWSPQFEGLVADRTTGIVYAGQEDVGIWRIDAATGAVDAEPLYTTRGVEGSPFHAPDSVIARDVEGLAILYGQTTRYLLASSQGNAHGDQPTPDAPWDDSYAVFEIGADGGLALRGSILAAPGGAMDGVQGSDGADVIATALPGFPEGLWVVHDQHDGDDLSGETEMTNFKYVSWGEIARSFTPPLEVNPAYDPRK